ncbi:MAG: uroporphyrinogen decarboxylase [Castellaniella sp.]|uniref:uroporphyrinogen decarboxylase n=1 Tax=Castellaniella sp. TaxID=1955812 RepID=UPI003C790C5F
MPELKNDTFLRALQRQPVAYTPMWMMRQAGRYLPEYNQTRAQAGSFMGLAQNPEYACEVTLQPLRRFDLDAAILFSDILTVPDAMGLGLQFVAGEGPRFDRPLRDEAAIQALQVPDLDRLRYVFDAVSLIRRELNGSVPLIGFSGSPWTLACYMVEGAGSSDYRQIKTLLYQRPDLLHRILSINAQAVQSYLNAQIRAGAQAVMVFDSWGGVLADGLFQQFSLAYTRQVLDGLIREHEGHRVPAIVFTKGGGQWIEDVAATGCDAVGLDWTANLAAARRRVGDQVALQGNLDPMTLFGSEAGIRTEVRRVLADFGTVGNGGHVFNLGHGISQFTPPEAVAILVDEVHTASRAYHAG